MFRSNRCSRSSSRMFGATSRAPHSRTDCSSSRCSSVKSKSIMRAFYCTARLAVRGSLFAVRRDECRSNPREISTIAPSDAEGLGGAAAVGGDLEVVGAAEQRADLPGANVGVGGDDAARSGGRRRSRSTGGRARAFRTLGGRCSSPGCRSDRRAARPRRTLAVVTAGRGMSSW